MIFTNSDGGSRGNPGQGAIGVIVRDEKKILIKYSSRIGQFVTNNIAEYEALIKALELAQNLTHDELTCFMDSELVVRHLMGEYKVRDPKLMPLFLKVQKLQDNFNKIIYRHVPREDEFQEIVDGLLNEELDRKN